MSQDILKIKNLTKYFGGLAAVSNCSFNIKKGTITGIIGPNGSGKTTLFNLIAGNLNSSTGQVFFNDEDITNVPSYELFSKGILRTFQIAHEFTNLSVLENLMMVPANQSGEKLMTALLKPSLVRTEELAVKQKAHDVVDFLNLTHLSNELAGNLSGGQKKLLELGRTMMVDAKLVLLDEVGAGVNRTLLKDLGTAIYKLNNVVLPDPFGPIMPVMVPFLTFKEQSETAARPPKYFDKLLISKMFLDIFIYLIFCECY